MHSAISQPIETICQAIRELRMIDNPDRRITMLVQVMVNHRGLNDPAMVELARAEVEQSRCSSSVRRDALAQLQLQSDDLAALDLVESQDRLRLLAPTVASRWLSQIVQTHSAQKSPSKPIRMDVELGRLCVALHLVAPYRLWSIGRELTRRSDGSGKLTRDAFFEALAGFGVEITRDHFSRLIREGRGIFWDEDQSQQMVFITSPRRVAPQIVQIAWQKNPDLVATNLPGGRDMYIDASDSHESFEAHIYAGWMSHRENPTVSRDVLATLFQRSGDTLRRWEQTRLQSSLTIRENYAQYEPDPGQWPHFIPDHAQAYLANVKREGRYSQAVRYRWRIPNTYKTSGVRQHPKRGQNQKVWRIVHRLLDQYSGGLLRPARVGQPTYFFGRAFEKLYFDDAKKLKKYVHAKDVSERMLWRGEDRCGRGVFEPTTSYGQTQVNERVRYKEEYRYFKQQEAKRRDYLSSRAIA